MLSQEYGKLDQALEERDLDADEWSRYKHIEKELDKFWRMDEIRIRKRSREREILEGDRNTTYFHAVANYRSRKKRIDFLESSAGHISDQKGMMDIALDFYKKNFLRKKRGVILILVKIFGKPPRK